LTITSISLIPSILVASALLCPLSISNFPLSTG
jgi:hypothetical protein